MHFILFSWWWWCVLFWLNKNFWRHCILFWLLEKTLWTNANFSFSWGLCGYHAGQVFGWSRSTKGGELQTQEPGLHAKTIFVPWRLLCTFCGSTGVVGQNWNHRTDLTDLNWTRTEPISTDLNTQKLNISTIHFPNTTLHSVVWTVIWLIYIHCTHLCGTFHVGFIDLGKSVLCNLSWTINCESILCCVGY